MNKLIRRMTLITAAAFIAVGLSMAEAKAEPVLVVTAIDTHGKTAEYLEALDTTIGIAKEIAPDGQWRVWVANYSGTSTGTVYVTVEWEDAVAQAEADVALSASDEFAASIAALAAMGRTIVSRATLNQAD